MKPVEELIRSIRSIHYWKTGLAETADPTDRREYERHLAKAKADYLRSMNRLNREAADWSAKKRLTETVGL